MKVTYDDLFDFQINIITLHDMDTLFFQFYSKCEIGFPRRCPAYISRMRFVDFGERFNIRDYKSCMYTPAPPFTNMV